MTDEGTERTDQAPRATSPSDGSPPVPAAPPAAVEAASHAPSVEPDAFAGSAVLDEAHIGDIEGALGRIRFAESERAATGGGLRRRLLTFLAILGPGMIVMIGDNDAGGVATYAQAGQNYGYSLLWTLMLLIPVLIVNQEMVVRLGAVTGVGHARLINERFGRFWGQEFLLKALRASAQLPQGRLLQRMILETRHQQNKNLRCWFRWCR